MNICMTDYDKLYIGDIYVEDIYAYTHMKKNKTALTSADTNYWEIESRLVTKLRAHKFENTTFCWAAALTETLWYVYRGMIKEAIIMDAMTMLLIGVLTHFSWKAGLIVWVLSMFVKGFLAIPLYWIQIKEKIEGRGLLMREPIENDTIRESLSREGKPNVGLTIRYFFYKCLAAICLHGVLFSVFAMWGL